MSPSDHPVRLIPYAEVLDRVGLSRGHVARLVNAGGFPKPVAVTPKRTAFVEAEIDRWIADRIAARDTTAGRRERRERSRAGTRLVRARWARAAAAEG